MESLYLGIINKYLIFQELVSGRFKIAMEVIPAMQAAGQGQYI